MRIGIWIMDLHGYLLICWFTPPPPKKKTKQKQNQCKNIHVDKCKVLAKSYFGRQHTPLLYDKAMTQFVTRPFPEGNLTTVIMPPSLCAWFLSIKGLCINNCMLSPATLVMSTNHISFYYGCKLPLNSNCISIIAKFFEKWVVCSSSHSTLIVEIFFENILTKSLRENIIKPFLQGEYHQTCWTLYNCYLLLLTWSNHSTEDYQHALWSHLHS